MTPIGKIKAMVDRELTYFAKINFLMIAYLFFKDVGWNWWYLCAIPVFLIWTYIDLRYIFPQELKYLHGKSPVFQELLKKDK